MDGPARIPLLSLILGYCAMLPFAIGALAAWLLAGAAAPATDLVVLWGGAILAFLAGVRRGLSFRTDGGPTAAQIGMTLWLFILGLSALALPSRTVALVLLLAGYASLMPLDPWAARRGEVPLFFEHLRPVQMTIPVFSLAGLLILMLWSRPA